MRGARSAAVALFLAAILAGTARAEGAAAACDLALLTDDDYTRRGAG
eukprot:gene40546-35154_t